MNIELIYARAIRRAILAKAATIGTIEVLAQALAESLTAWWWSTNDRYNQAAVQVRLAAIRQVTQEIEAADVHAMHAQAAATTARLDAQRIRDARADRVAELVR